MLALYLCYVLLLILYFTSTDAWLYEWTELDEQFNYGMSPVVHTTINIRTLVNFVICTILPLGTYWIVRLFCQDEGRNNNISNIKK